MRYRFGDHVLDTRTVQLVVGDEEVDLEPQVYAVLAHLVTNRDRVVTKEELLDEVWGSRFVSESALTTRIKQVRQAVGDSGRQQQVVRTVHGRGYRFVADAEELEAPASPSPNPTTRGRPRTRYADGDGATLAYQTFGEGPDLALIAGYATNVDAQWEHPAMADFLHRLGQVARVTVLDKRGVGLSERLPHDAVPSLETRADDLNAVLDAAGVERASVLGSSEGGSLSAVFAAAYPERVDRLILHNTWVRGPDFALGRRSDLDFVLERWGTGRVYTRVGPSLAAHPDGRELLASYERQSATPRTARHLLELIGEIDIEGILGAISVPTLVLHAHDDPIVPIADGRRLAAAIPGARLTVLSGADHFLLAADPAEVVGAIAGFLDTGPVDGGGGDRILATVLFVDLVDSTGRAQALGDQRWTARLDRFHERARTIVAAHRGRLVNTTGDGVLATFDGPGRAVRAAGDLRAAIRSLELTMRAGLHTAEIQCRGDDIAGIGVHIAGRVAAAAQADEIWVSRTVTDLVAGTGLAFEPRGEHELRGIDQSWMLYAASL
jgi:pimeloyl-ACP methyl ester carboxylesterase/DNA-binding winged helix-turn-helix (wHTH) protein